MRRLLATLLTLTFAATLPAVPPAHAAEAPMTTVKVIGYTFTKDGRVRPFSQGSATILTSDGYLLTNHHASVNDEEETHDVFEICLTYPGNLLEPQCIGTASYVVSDKENDIAVLKMDTRDIFSQSLPALPALSFDNAARPVVGDEVTMIGYPDIGQDSVTFTNGKVSGFVTLDGTEYFKSDAKISNGNSGGTAINKNGVFIGIPSAGDASYTSLESLGFILPVADYKDWIKKGLTMQPQTNKDANAKLQEQMRLLFEANKSRTLTVMNTPGFAVTAQPYWRFSSNSASVNRFSRLGDFILSSKDGSAYVAISVNKQAYEKTVEKLAEEQHRNDRSLRTLPGYKVEKVTLNDKYPALKISLQQKDYQTEGGKEDRIQTEYHIPFGTSVVAIASSATTGEPKQNAADVEKIVSSFMLDTGKKPNFTITSYQSERPVISLTNPEPNVWKMAEAYYYRRAPDLSLHLENPQDDKAGIGLSYDEYQDHNTDGDYAKFLENLVKDAKEYGSLLNSGANITIGGRRGIFILTKEISELNDDPLNPFVRLTIVIPDGKYYYSMMLSCQSKTYGEYLSYLKKLLSTVAFSSEKGRTNLTELGTLDGVFLDTANHRYEKDIGALKAEGIVKGYSDRTFRPYKMITRAEFLKMVLDAMPKKEADDLAAFLNPAPGSAARTAGTFHDVQRDAWYARYVYYATERKIIRGYSDGTFRPKQAVTLAEGLKILLLAHGITVWQPLPQDNTAWYFPYMDKAFELGLLPAEMSDPSRQLLRGQGAHILNTLRQSDKNKYDL